MEIIFRVKLLLAKLSRNQTGKSNHKLLTNILMRRKQTGLSGQRSFISISVERALECHFLWCIFVLASLSSHRNTHVPA